MFCKHLKCSEADMCQISLHSYQNHGSGAKPASPGLDKDVQRASGNAQEAAAMVPFCRGLVEAACEGGQ